MYPVSATFADTISSGSQIAVVRACVTLGDTELGDLTIKSGSVTVDGRREGPLRTLSLAVAPDDDAWGWLTAYGAEIRVWRGLRLPDGDELVPLGVFVVDGDIAQTDGREIPIAASDRSERITRARWTSAFRIAAGTDVGTAAEMILTDRWAACPIGFAALGPTLGAPVVYQPGGDTDPWKDARSLLSDRGYDLYFDNDGVARVREIPDPALATPDAVYHAGELSVVTEETRTASFASSYNGVVATGEGSEIEPPVRGEAWDDDPLSPTYRYGPLGMVPEFYSSPLLTTQAAVDQAAATRLSKVRGKTTRTSWKRLVNPAHEAYDVIVHVAEDGTATRYMLDVLEIPLQAADPMPATARETRVV